MCIRDSHAANVVFSSPIPLWQVPKNVYEMMPVSFAELECRVLPQGVLGKYLFEQLLACQMEETSRKSPFRTGETWVLGDSPAPGLLLYEHRFCFDWIGAPLITRDMTYVHTKQYRPIRAVSYTHLEWAHSHPAADSQHRHTSHLLGVFPYAQITPEGTPELAEAAWKSMESRMCPEDNWEDTGWARSLLLLYSARLRRKEAASHHLRSMQKELTHPRCV